MKRIFSVTNLYSFSFRATGTALIALTLVSCGSKKAKPAPEPKDSAALSPKVEEAIGVEEDSAPSAPPKALAWNYSDVAKWGDSNPNYVLCGKGLEQSPVDLKWSKPLVARSIEYIFTPGIYQIEAHPQKLQVTFAKGNHTKIDGAKWNLVAMQLHTPGEHSFSKRSFPLEAHLVHYNEEQTKLGIVAVVFQVGKPNMGIEAILKSLPAVQPGKVLVEDNPLNPALFLPLVNTHYAYQGSLTTPPCTEGVNWTVLNTPVEISEEQLVKLKKALGPNARPAQKLNHRKAMNYK